MNKIIALVASLLLASSVFAAATPAPAAKDSSATSATEEMKKDGDKAAE